MGIGRSVANVVLATGLACAAMGATAITPEELARLDSDLTPVGAERAGNAAGTIPTWTGGLAQRTLDPNIGYIDPYADDRVLFTITATNADQYADQLAPGHREMFRQFPASYRMHVYPTRRSANWPEAVLEQVKLQAPLARTRGYELLDVGRTAVPFPITTDPLQMMWNHSLRWRGGSVKRVYSWFPVDRRGRYFAVRVLDTVAWDQQGYMKESRPNRLANFYAMYLAPANIEGQLTLVWEPVNPVADSRQAWTYQTVTRRVVRVPSLAYDDLDRRTQGLRTTDQYDGWNGAPDLYDWTLVGKREMFIPYNSYRLTSKRLKYADILQPGHLNPDLLRYELHRVWVIEATLRPGKHHRYPRRTFYLDEDTWQVSMEEDYNSEGALWRFGSHPAMQFYDVLVPWYAAMVHHDFESGAYLASDLENESSIARSWGWKGDINDFLPVNLRRLGTR
ncbi:MAG: DUF1329 domain-containing protein [Pseudomonadales bacterium]|nr:DUF1329 domain-containing protein [Pseudomonadales bacterium]MCP5191726.1 DUF1329 domain-containing protein [Pseudomonadales bacterium]